MVTPAARIRLSGSRTRAFPPIQDPKWLPLQTLAYYTYCLPLPPLLAPSTRFLALFFYLQFQHAIDKLYCVHCPRSGHVCPRKHTVPITSLLLRFSSLQDRSCAVHLPCSVSALVATPERLLGRPSPVHPAYICLQFTLIFHASEEFCPFTIGFLFIFIFAARKAHWSVQWIGYKVLLASITVYYPVLSWLSWKAFRGARCPVLQLKSLVAPPLTFRHHKEDGHEDLAEIALPG